MNKEMHGIYPTTAIMLQEFISRDKTVNTFTFNGMPISGDLFSMILKELENRFQVSDYGMDAGSYIIHELLTFNEYELLLGGIPTNPSYRRF